MNDVVLNRDIIDGVAAANKIACTVGDDQAIQSDIVSINQENAAQ
ncbi:hypothetical protein MalM14_31210 [Gimesia chilikensis]|nr:hypothetical protein MalM14_31210 [Gimesia chilikensis]